MNNGKEKKYFSMFTGVGGFELGIARSCGDDEHHSQETNTHYTKRNKSISKEQQEFNNSGNHRQTTNTQNSNGTLFQNRQISSNSISKDLGTTEEDFKLGQSVRQTSDRIIREGDGIRDDSESLQFTENKPYSSEFRCIGFSEIDKFASELLKNKFPTVKNYGDATKIIPEELPDFELLVGGFPCQAFSIAGKRKGFEDTRGTLFHDIVRILKVKRPRNILLENVKGLLNHDGGRTFATILASLSELGYVIQWMVFNSKFFGVPQNRERVFIIGSLRGEPIPEILPLGESDRRDNEK